MKAILHPLQKRLSISVQYDTPHERNLIIERIQTLLRSNSICHQDVYYGGRFSFQIEDMGCISEEEKNLIIEEPDFDTITARVELINGKKCLVYKSRM